MVIDFDQASIVAPSPRRQKKRKRVAVYDDNSEHIVKRGRIDKENIDTADLL